MNLKSTHQWLVALSAVAVVGGLIALDLYKGRRSGKAPEARPPINSRVETDVLPGCAFRPGWIVTRKLTGEKVQVLTAYPKACIVYDVRLPDGREITVYEFELIAR